MSALLDVARRHVIHRHPQPPDVPPRIAPIAAEWCVFDVYGTLLSSAAGEVGTATPAGSAFAAISELLGLPTRNDSALARGYHRGITERHTRSRDSGITWPEVDIRDVWSETLAAVAGNRTFSDAEVERVALEYEVRANPVGAMPGAAEVIQELRRRGHRLAIVSNAQFYTPLVMEAIFGADPSSLGFEYAVWSYELGRAKPDGALFETLIERLPQGVSIAYVGNDMRNDVAAAYRAGMRTVLFAGDDASYRPRLGDAFVGEVRADATITSLNQLLDVITARRDVRNTP